MKMWRLVGAALCAATLAAPAAAQSDYPTRPVTLIVPYPAGGNADIAVRALAEGLEKELGVSIAVTPTPGAGGITGTQKMLSSRPDGYTLLVAAQSTITVQTQTRKLSFDWDKPSYIATIAAPTTYIGVDAKNEKVKSFQDFIAQARENPGKMNMAIIGGGLYQTIALRLQKRLGVDFVTLPFNGGPPMVAAVLGGHADMLITDNYNSALRPIALTGESSKDYPGVPTLEELGYPEVKSGVNYIVAAPDGTPDAVLGRLEAAFEQAAKTEKFREVLGSLKWGAVWRNRAETQKVVATEAGAIKELVDSGLMARQE